MSSVTSSVSPMYTRVIAVIKADPDHQYLTEVSLIKAVTQSPRSESCSASGRVEELDRYARMRL